MDLIGRILNKSVFNSLPGQEHYHLLKELSTQINGKEIFDIGTWKGASALALSFNQTNTVHSFDLVHSHILPKISNIVYHLANIVTNTPDRELWKERILASPLIFLDIDPHEGKDEYVFYEWLRDNNYKGVLICDDIHHFEAMRNNFWSKIPNEFKTDLTSQGHWSGTGKVQFTSST
jgi:hypothetical protein